MAIWWQEAMYMCAANVCGLCGRHISTGSCLYNQIPATWVRHEEYSYFSRPLTLYRSEKFRPLSFVTSLNTGNHATSARPFLFHNKASPIPNVLIVAQSLPVKYKTFLSCNFFWIWQPICSWKPAFLLQETWNLKRTLKWHQLLV